MAFRYYLVKKAVGNSPYTTRPNLSTPLTEDEVIRNIEAATSITGGDIQNVFLSLRRVLLEAALNGRPSQTLFGLFRTSLACGGSIQDPEQSLTLDDIDPRITIYLAPQIQKDFRSNVTIERSGIASDRVPEIQIVRNLATENLDTYSSANPLRILGNSLKVQKSDPNQGVFLQPEGGGPEVRMSLYIDNTQGNLTVLVPDTVTGPQRLIIRALFGSSLRETIYPVTLLEE